MRDIKALAFVCALIAACATTGGGGDDGVDPPTDTPTCGDAVCAASEIGVCAADCGTGGPSTPVCGNNTCEGNEPTECPTDCAVNAVCGNNTCEASETNATCPGDCTTGGGGNCPADPIECFPCLLDPLFCPSGHTAATCQACILGGGGGLPMCPNGVCDAGETNASCPTDCP
jgi:hypothetical protein